MMAQLVPQHAPQAHYDHQRAKILLLPLPSLDQPAMAAPQEKHPASSPEKLGHVLVACAHIVVNGPKAQVRAVGQLIPEPLLSVPLDPFSFPWVTSTPFSLLSGLG